MKEIEPYDLMYEHVSKAKKNHQTNETLICNCYQQAHEWLPYEEFSIDMRKSNDNKNLQYMIVFTKNSSIHQCHYICFSEGCMQKGNCHINFHHTKHVNILYKI